MSDTFPQLDERHPAPVGITASVALSAWLIAWLAGGLVGAAMFQAGGAPTHVAGMAWFLAVGTAIGWVVMVGAAGLVSRRDGSGHIADDYGLRFRPADLGGIPIGIATQLLAVPALYWPLRRAWPATFDQAKLEKNARDLVSATTGVGWVLLVLMVVVGAPLVEEVVYRGLIHGSLVRRFSHIVAVVASAALFAAIHVRPVEFPGLFLVGVVLAVSFSVTRRLGLGIVAHAAFNAAALVVASR